MKECIICGTKADESATVCEVCGSSDFESEDKSQAVMQAEEEPIYSNDPDSVYRVRKKIDPNSKIKYKKAKPFKPKNPVEISVPGGGVVSGIFGAFLFSLIGGVIYMISLNLGFLSSVCGIATFSFANLGYKNFSKTYKTSIASLLTSAVVTVVTIVLSEFLALGFSIFWEYRNEGLGLISAFGIIPELIEIPEVASGIKHDFLYTAVSTSLWAIISFINYLRMRRYSDD
ncbi:MAG: hypothetical protein ACI4IX_02855 [Acutalibacteraceae bacterium]